MSSVAGVRHEEGVAAPQVTIVRGTQAGGGKEVIRVAAMKDSQGIFGFARIKFPGRFKIRGPVLCYQALAANVSRVGFRIDRAKGRDPRLKSNNGFIVYLIDGALDGSEDIIGTGFVPDAPRDCGDRQIGFTPFERGDVRINN